MAKRPQRHHRKLLSRRHRSLEDLEVRTLLAALPWLTEFVAANRDSQLDGYGSAEDWIELQNLGDEPAQLAGYSLSDDPTRQDGWAFPETLLKPGEALVVFASGRDERDPAGQLHTNFRLSDEGEYLALSAPDGSLVNEFTFPAQREDVGYGIGQVETLRTFVDGNSPAKLHVVRATDEAVLGLAWNGGREPFDDTAWDSVQAAIGFGSGSLESNTNIARGTDVTASGPLWPGFVATRLTDGDLNTISHPATSVRSFSYTVDLGATYDLERIRIFNRNDGCCTDRLTRYQVTLHDDDEGSPGPALWTGNLRANGTNSGVGGVDTVESSLDPTGQFRGRYVIIAKPDSGSDNYWPQIAEVEVYPKEGYENLVQSDIGTAMQGISTAALLRVPFDVERPDDFTTFELQMQYDDGFVAYLNGVEVARRNASQGTPPLLSSATASHLGTSLETFPLPKELVQSGANQLTFQVLNQSLADEDLLLLPLVRARQVNAGAAGYLMTPTPGAINGPTVAGFTEGVMIDRPRGFYDAAFVATLSPTTAGSTLIYTLDGSTPSRTNGVQVPAATPNGLVQTSVNITTTTTLRAMAIHAGDGDSPVETLSYLFLRDVLQQPTQPDGLPASWAGTPGDYAMDPEVVDSPAYRDEMLAAMRSIPTLSIVTDTEHLWDATSGIYINSTQRGEAWERPTSLEWILPDGSTGFQVNAGLRMWGTGWAPHSSSKKHSFQLKFKSKYGPTKLEYPLFPDAPVTEFDDIVLRAQGSRSWSDFRQPDINQTQYLRDAWARDTASEMGKLDGHATFVHLYLNGLYWGLYNPVERTNEQFAEEYIGGEAEEYDVINRRSGQATHATSGNMDAWNEMLALAGAGLESPAAYAAIQQYLDVDDFIDYMLLQQYATNHDGPDQGGNNMRALRRRTEDGRFTFHVWDMEYTLWYEDEHRNIDGDVPDSPMRLLTKLRENAEFRQRYSDRAHLHLTNGGALTAERASARYALRAAEIEQAILGESARWGDARRSQPFTRDVEWVAERDRLLNEYFPQRTAILIDQLRDAGLFSDVATPQFDVDSGSVPAGSTWEISGSGGAVYYTLDGTDPRLAGGTISAAARSFVPTRALIGEGTVFQVSVPTDGRDGTQWTQLDTQVDASRWTTTLGPVGFDTRAIQAAVPVVLQNATATFSQLNRSVANLIDGDPAGRGWGLSQPVDFQGPVIRAATAVFETVNDVDYADGTELTFTIVQNVSNRNNLGRFRLSVTTDARDTFADGEPNGGDVAANWIVLQPHNLISAEDAQFTLDPDGSILVSGGANSRDIYTISATTSLRGITGIRMETLNDHTLPGRAGPGRSANGAAMVSEFSMSAAPARITRELDDVRASQLAAAFGQQHTSLYTRIPFQAADVASLTDLELRLRYTDGFVAYLNGSPIAYRNVASEPVAAFDSRATLQRDTADTWQFESIDVSSALPLLRDGENLLAIHLLQASPLDRDLLLSPQLIGHTSLQSIAQSPTTVRARTLLGTAWSAMAPLNLTTFGDFNNDQRLDVRDVDLICLAIRRDDTTHDLTGDQQIDVQDLNYLITQGFKTTLGDVNLDGQFNSTDLVLVFQRGEYEDGTANNSTWVDGDWNCDGEFTTSDLVAAFQAGGYQ